MTDISKKVIICDMDGTLTPSKSPLGRSMSEAVCDLLASHRMAVISGGDYPQFQTQFVSHLVCGHDRLANLLLFPTSGAECFMYDESAQEWRQVYDELLSIGEKEKIINAFDRAIAVTHAPVAQAYGPLIEDRGEQITFSGQGQHAPISVKQKWDPDQSIRRSIVEELEQDIPEFEITIGGMTSIDVTKKGVNKAYAIRKVQGILGVRAEDIVFLGDALYPGGNDTKARDAGVECIQVSGPEETEEILRSYAQDGSVRT